MLTTCVYSGAAGFFCPAPATLPAHYMARRALQNLRSAMISSSNQCCYFSCGCNVTLALRQGTSSSNNSPHTEYGLPCCTMSPYCSGLAPEALLTAKIISSHQTGAAIRWPNCGLPLLPLEIRLSMLTITPSANFLQDTCGCVNTLKACAMLSQ